MKNKHNRHGLLVTSIVSPANAIVAFARGDTLTTSERKRVMTEYFKESRMSLKKACIVAIKYGLGLIGEEKVELHRLTEAWIRLGEKVWQKIIATVQKIAKTVLLDQRFLSRFCAKFQILFSHNKPAWTW